MSDDSRGDRARDLAVSKALVKLIMASVLLNALILAALLTSTPERSPASTWVATAYKLKLRIAPVDPVKDKAKLASMHLDSAHIRTPECISCHGTMLDSEVAFHRIHLRNELLPGLDCNDCHKRIDLTPRGNAAVVELVDVGFCKKCHSQFPGLLPGSPMTPMDFEIDCTMCHSGDHAFRHEPTYLSQIIAPRECRGCHGGRVLPWDPLHERGDWLQLHGPEALRTGNKTCFRCHDFGLKFCDTCHALKPPSHLPAEQWLSTHRPAAKADTRVCHTCHNLDFCKRCHLSHEAGWKKSHPSFVQVNGSVSCRKCHSESFCTYCHMDSQPASTGSTSTP